MAGVCFNFFPRIKRKKTENYVPINLAKRLSWIYMNISLFKFADKDFKPLGDP